MTSQQFARAHDRYLQPPEEPAMITCKECEGEGTIPCSDCCDSEIRNGHCMECGENCVPAKCPTCEGLGEVEPIEEEQDHEDDEND